MTRFTPRLAVLLTVLLLSALTWATAPFTLGEMIQLGRATGETFPASSTTITGALLFDLDAGVPKYNDGTAWNSFATVTSTFFWRDAGAGYIFADESLLNPDAGTALRIGTASGGTGIGFATTGARLDLGALTNDYLYSVQLGGIDIIATPGAVVSSNVGAGFSSSAASAAVGFETTTTGARWNFGAGASDYLVSDGTGVECASYLKPATFTTGTLPASSSTTTGAVAWNSTTAVETINDGAAWRDVIAVPNGQQYSAGIWTMFTPQADYERDPTRTAGYAFALSKLPGRIKLRGFSAYPTVIGWGDGGVMADGGGQTLVMTVVAFDDAGTRTVCSFEEVCEGGTHSILHYGYDPDCGQDGGGIINADGYFVVTIDDTECWVSPGQTITVEYGGVK